MPTVRQGEPIAEMIAIGLIAISGVLLPMEMVPGWSMIGLDWPPWVFYAIITVFWGVGFGMLGAPYRVPAILGGMIGGVGCLLAISTLLANVSWINNYIIGFTGLVGALPGGVVYLMLCWIQDRIIPPPPPPVLTPPEEPVSE